MNGASGAGGPVAPGEVVLITGGTIGPSPLAAARVPSSGSVATTLATTSVTFNGTPAPILYASASATSVIVPYELTGSSTANVVVKFRDQTTAAFQTPVALTAPGLFTLNAGGTGPLVALNQDGSVNGTNVAATQGSVVTVFATGEGPTNPPGADGVVTGNILREPWMTVSAKIGGQAAQVVYAGSAIGFVAGVMQVEMIVPSGAGAGAVPVVLTVGTASSQSGVTIALK